MEDVVSKRRNHFSQASHVMQQETLATLTEIVEKFNIDQSAVTEMGEANSILSTANTTMKEQVGAVKTKLNTIFQKITAIEKRMGELETGGVRNCTGSKPKIQGEYTRKPKYCFTCGTNLWHQSPKCKIRMPGHKEEETMVD